jgi:hypothetical protein
MEISRVTRKYTTVAARSPYFTYPARCSSHGGGSRRSFAGTTVSSSWVSAPYAQIRPQYSRPHNTVEARVNVANRYHARLYLKIGRFHVIRPKTLTIEINWLLKRPR